MASFKEKISQNIEFRKVHLIPSLFISLFFSSFVFGLLATLWNLSELSGLRDLFIAPFVFVLYSIFLTPYLALPYYLCLFGLIYFKRVNLYTCLLSGFVIGLILWLWFTALDWWIPLIEYGYILYPAVGIFGGWITYHWLDIFSKENDR